MSSSLSSALVTAVVEDSPSSDIAPGIQFMLSYVVVMITEGSRIH